MGQPDRGENWEREGRRHAAKRHGSELNLRRFLTHIKASEFKSGIFTDIFLCLRTTCKHFLKPQTLIQTSNQKPIQ